MGTDQIMNYLSNLVYKKILTLVYIYRYDIDIGKYLLILNH
jgi:hypothetical protein